MNGNVYSSPPMEIAFQLSDTIVTRLVTDYNSENQMTLAYVGTHDGQVLKLVQKKKGEKFLLLTSWIVDENSNEKSPIRNMILASVRHQSFHSFCISVLQDTKQLYVSTDFAVYQFPVNQCNRYILCTECARDPLCHYDVQENRCLNLDEK